jgi:hypothetical protein
VKPPPRRCHGGTWEDEGKDLVGDRGVPVSPRAHDPLLGLRLVAEPLPSCSPINSNDIRLKRVKEYT